VQIQKRESVMKNLSDKKYFSIETNAPLALTIKQREEIDALNALDDEKIDYSDIPPLTDEFWKQATVNPFVMKHKRVTTTVCVDADILLWLKLKGKNYQACINTILKHEMLKEREQAKLTLLNHEQ
jgi:uncharacterized protein (DUF4415 family)